MSGIAIFGLAALSAWLAINITIAIAAVCLGGASPKRGKSPAAQG
jgi:hypothetical protein